MAAACVGGDTNRIVWVDVFAVRQWPGNGADLDFRGVLAGCTAAIVSSAPVEGKLTSREHNMGSRVSRAFFLESPEYAAIAKVLPPCRLWCVVEFSAVIELGKPLLFSCSKVVVGSGEEGEDDDGEWETEEEWESEGGEEVDDEAEGLGSGSGSGSGSGGGGGSDMGAGGGVASVTVERGVEAYLMLHNCSYLVDVAEARAAVQADKDRELARIGSENFAQFNRTVAAALAAGALAVRWNVSEVDAFSCGEPGPLRALAEERVPAVFRAACAAGQLAVMLELWHGRGETVVAYLQGEKGKWELVYLAAMNGHVAVLEWLVRVGGASLDVEHPRNGVTALSIAVQQGHIEVTQFLLDEGADVGQEGVNNYTPLHTTVLGGHPDVARRLLASGADVHRTSRNGETPLILAASNSYVDAPNVIELLEILLEAGADITAMDNFGDTALTAAEENGHEEVSSFLRQLH